MAASEFIRFFGDAEHNFRLRLAQIEELERLTGVGLGTLARRVIGGDFYMGDLVHTVRLALIGGGMKPVRAKQLLDTYGDGTIPIAEDDSSIHALAKAALLAVYVGLPKEEPKKKDDIDAGKNEATGKRTESTSPEFEASS